MSEVFLARLQAMREGKSATAIPAPVVTHVAPITASYAHKVDAQKPMTKAHSKPAIDIIAIIDDMGDWCDETHDMPDQLTMGVD